MQKFNRDKNRNKVKKQKQKNTKQLGVTNHPFGIKSIFLTKNFFIIFSQELHEIRIQINTLSFAAIFA